MNIIKYVRGGIYYADLGINKGSEQSNTRPVVVISNDLNNTHSNVITVIPITGAEKTQLPVHVMIPSVQNNHDNPVNTVLCEQIRAISTERIKNFIGILDAEAISKIETALKIQLGIEPIETKTPKNETPITKNHSFISYSDDYKRQFMKDAATRTTAEVAKKYNISIKAAYARKTKWINYK